MSSTNRAQSIRMALTRLRASVLVWCTLIVISILVQMLAWGITTFTDLRYREPDFVATTPLVVTQPGAGTDAEVALMFAVTQGLELDEGGLSLPTQEEEQPLNKRGVPTKWDQLVRDTMNWSGVVGTLSIMLVVSLVLLGTLIAIMGRHAGVEMTISAFTWALIIATLTLPLKKTALAEPWQDGIFRAAAQMIKDVEAHRPDYGGDGITVAFFLRYAVMPIICIVGVGLLSARFSAGVAAGLISEAQRLDPKLDAEAHEVAEQASSLHGSGRASGALTRILRPPDRQGGAGADDDDDDDVLDEEFDEEPVAVPAMPRRPI